MAYTRDQVLRFIASTAERLGSPVKPEEQQALRKWPYHDLCDLLRRLEATEWRSK